MSSKLVLLITLLVSSPVLGHPGGHPEEPPPEKEQLQELAPIHIPVERQPVDRPKYEVKLVILSTLSATQQVALVLLLWILVWPVVTIGRN